VREHRADNPINLPLEDEVVDEPEAFALLHTTMDRVQQVIDRVGELHPYDTSQALSFAVTHAPTDYAEWVNDGTAGS